MTILIFWTKFAEKGYFRLKTEEMNIAIKFCVFEIVQVTNFTLNWQVRFFRPNLHEKVNTTTEFCRLELV